MYTLDLNAIGLIVLVGAAVGLLLGLVAGLLLAGGEEKPPRRGLVSALRLWRRKTDGALWVQLPEEEAADSPQGLPAEQRAALERLLSELAHWLGAPPPAAASPSAAASPPEPPRSLNPFKPFRDTLTRRRSAAEEPVLPPASLSIAAQVDEILQEMLEGTPLEARGIRLMELPGQGMVVLVGLEKFVTVDEVPYDDVRAVLKAAVARWETKMLGE